MFGRRRTRSSRTRHISRAGTITADTRAVRASTVPALVDAAVELGYSREGVLVGLPYTDEELRRPRARVSWNELLQVLDNLERQGMPLGDFERAGAILSASPHMLVSRFADFFIRPEHLVFASLQWIGPSLFPVLDHAFDYDHGRARLELIVPEQLPGSATYFHVCAGTIGAIPTLIGHSPAALQTEISARRAVFDIRCLPRAAGGERFGRLVRALLSVPRLVDMLVSQERAARDSFEAMLDSQAQFRRILEAMPDGVVVLRGDAIAYVNKALARLLGRDLTSSVLAERWSELVGAGDGVAGPPAAPVERRFVQDGGAEVVLELSSRESITYEGVPAELIVVRDVTLRHELQGRLALADRMSSLGTLAAGVAHEINNPLALVMSNLELAARRPGESERFVRSAIEGAGRVRDIVRDLRVFAKPEPETPEPVDLGEVISSSVALARGKVQTRARLETELESVPLVAAGHGKLGQVVLNLIINAFEALPEERGAGENRIVVRLRRAGDKIRLEVEDNGAGIAPAVRARLFEPFFTTRAGHGGSGLGLAVVHDIVSHSGGTIEVISELGRGALFRVELPPADPVLAPAAGETAKLDSRGARILVVDDEPALLRALAETLSADGHEVVSAGSGRAAMAIIDRDDGFDLVLCDLMMPDGSGADVHAHIVRDHPGLAANVVFMTAGTFRSEMRSFLGSSGNRCLHKPFCLDELSDLVADALR